LNAKQHCAVLIESKQASMKTTLVSLLAKHYNLDIVEVSCCIKRTGAEMKQVLGDALKSRTLKSFGKLFNFKQSNAKAKVFSMIVLEDVDYVYQDETGFWKFVASLIADTKHPVILTCSDISWIPPGMAKLRRLKVCRFADADHGSIHSELLQTVANRCGMLLSPECSRGILRRQRHDLRQALNWLDIIRRGQKGMLDEFSVSNSLLDQCDYDLWYTWYQRRLQQEPYVSKCTLADDETADLYLHPKLVCCDDVFDSTHIEIQRHLDCLFDLFGRFDESPEPTQRTSSKDITNWDLMIVNERKRLAEARTLRYRPRRNVRQFVDSEDDDGTETE
jgi:hypothetical protein